MTCVHIAEPELRLARVSLKSIVRRAAASGVEQPVSQPAFSSNERMNNLGTIWSQTPPSRPAFQSYHREVVHNASSSRRKRPWARNSSWIQKDEGPTSTPSTWATPKRTILTTSKKKVEKAENPWQTKSTQPRGPSLLDVQAEQKAESSAQGKRKFQPIDDDDFQQVTHKKFELDFPQGTKDLKGVKRAPTAVRIRTLIRKDEVFPGLLVLAPLHEPDSESREHLDPACSMLNPHFGWIYSKNRPMVVIAVFQGHYLCLPVYSFRREGLVAAREVNEYISIWDPRRPAKDQINQSSYKPIDCEMLYLGSWLQANSAIHLTYPISKKYMKPVEVIGHISKESAERLLDLHNNFKSRLQTSSRAFKAFGAYKDSMRSKPSVADALSLEQQVDMKLGSSDTEMDHPQSDTQYQKVDKELPKSGLRQTGFNTPLDLWDDDFSISDEWPSPNWPAKARFRAEPRPEPAKRQKVSTDDKKSVRPAEERMPRILNETVEDFLPAQKSRRFEVVGAPAFVAAPLNGKRKSKVAKKPKPIRHGYATRARNPSVISGPWLGWEVIKGDKREKRKRY